MEIMRLHEMPDLFSLPEGADVTVELYGGSYSLRLDRENPRIYVRRFVYAPFSSDEEARRAFLSL
jgi:hypothetical protein